MTRRYHIDEDPAGVLALLSQSLPTGQTVYGVCGFGRDRARVRMFIVRGKIFSGVPAMAISVSAPTDLTLASSVDTEQEFNEMFFKAMPSMEDEHYWDDYVYISRWVVTFCDLKRIPVTGVCADFPLEWLPHIPLLGPEAEQDLAKRILTPFGEGDDAV